MEYMRCPKKHFVAFKSSNYARDDSEGLRDADGRPMYEDGLWCFLCQRAYGLSKLEEVEKDSE